MHSIQRVLLSFFTATSVFCAGYASAALPAAPENLQPAWLFGEILLTWNEVPDAFTYNVYQFNSADNTWSLTTNGLTVPRYRAVDSGVATFTVTAVNASGEGPAAAPVDCVQTGDPFALYIDQWSSPIYDTAATIQWSVNLLEGADGMLEVGPSWTNLTFVGWDTNYTTVHRITATNLLPGTAYYGRVTSVASNRTGVTGWTTFVTLQTNHPPIAQSQTFNTWEDPWQPLQIWFSGWDPDNFQQVTFQILDGPFHGTLTHSNYSYTYMPETNWFGVDYITFVASDGRASSEIATNFINVAAVPDAPVGINQSVVTGEDMPVTITPQATDVENDFATFWISTWPTNGWLQTTATNVIYTPLENRVGSDFFAFIPIDSWNAWGQPGYVSITITNINDPPGASNSWVTVHAGSSYTGFLSAGDIDGDAVTCELVTPPSSGSVSISGKIFTYTPNPGTYFSDNFTFRAFDGQAYSGEATLWIWVAETNRVPEVQGQPITVIQNTETWFSFMAFDPDGDPLSPILITTPTNGTVELQPYVSFIYRPAPDFLGSDTFTYQVWDGSVTSAVATVSINVVPFNTPPVAYSSNFTTVRDIALSLHLGASDAEGNPLTYIITSSPAHGSLAGTAPDLVYTPAAGFTGTDSFTFKVNDGTIDGDPATVSIVVTRPNQAPVAASQSSTLVEDTSRSIVLSASDADGDPLTYLILSGPAHGTVTGSGANRIYTPAANYNGADSFTFTANDGIADGNAATVSLTITPVNDAPVLLTPNQSYNLREDWIIYFGVLASDPDGDTLTYRIVTPPSHGTLNTSNSFQSLNYHGFPNFAGVDTFTWVANDGLLDSPVGTVTINVTNVNDAPVTTNQVVTMAEDSTLNITPLVADPDNDPLILSVNTQPLHGSLSINGATFVYRPVTNYHGADSFTYRASDGTLSSPDTTVSITIQPVNDSPTANSLIYAVNEDTPSNLTLTGADIDGDALNFIIVSGPSHGTLSGTGSIRTYSPTANFHGPDSFTFKANDGSADSAPATITINVASINDPPAAADKSVVVDEDQSVSITFTAIDPDEDALTFSILTSPTNGVLTGTPPNVTYTPNANFNGSDHFTYRAFDTVTGGNTALVTITVNPVNDAPVANPQSITTDEDTAANITLSASDIDGDALTFVIVDPPSHGTLSGTGANRIYTPASNYNGTDSFSFQGNDGTVGGNIATVSITITAVNDAPVATAQSVTTAEDTAVNITLTGSDIDGDALTFAIVGGPAHGTLSGTGANRIYTPDANYNGSDAFTFKVNDGTVDGNTATVSITVTAVNDAPIANSQNVTTAEDTAVNITLSGSDIDGDSLSFSIVAGPAHGTLTGIGADRTYTPAANYNGPDSFTFKVNDGTVGGNIATVTITVTAVNDAPIANSQSVATAEDTAVNITLTGSDIDGDSLSFTIVAGPTHGTLIGTGATRTYTPAANYNGPDSFTFKVNDGIVDGSIATVSITVTAVNDAPVANNQAVTVGYNSSTAIILSGNDVDGNPLAFTILSNPAHGTLTGTAPNLTYTPVIGYSGPDSFTFRANDGSLNSATATISITVQAPASVPAAPSALTATAVSQTQINLAWTDNSSNEDGFKIERSTNGSTFTEIGTVGPNVRSYSSTGLSPNKLYYYRVRAYNSLGNSGYSNTASTKTLK